MRVSDTRFSRRDDLRYRRGEKRRGALSHSAEVYEMTGARFWGEGRQMKSLPLVFCISVVIAADALPAAAQMATTCTQRLALCDSACANAQRMGPAAPL